MLIDSGSDMIYEAFKALIIYKKKEYHSDNQFYIESANIINEELKEQRPLTKDEFIDLMAPIKQASKLNQIDYSISYTDKNIISYSSKNNILNLTWFVKAHENNFIFGRKNKTNKLKYPNLIFNIKGNSFRIFCFKGNLKGLETNLYKAPFPNIYAANDMCFGNINVKSLLNKDIHQTILNYENAFFNSGFNALESANRTKSNTFELLKRLIKSKERFPTKELVPLKTKLKNVIS